MKKKKNEKRTTNWRNSMGNIEWERERTKVEQH